ncbi:hypothetical protein H4217_002144 [Coemansia sp. RSA 1939]|nr:hypothetical protein H4217_002144 [Coemansia sp. RSA 1939]KAJ2614645.1 hypothetical protein EV177_001948 [Coemansia sp. RSA 1804]KAJ2694921.1 hypothetical protein GGH99_000432 [Coemansia sp. RSA 1285]
MTVNPLIGSVEALKRQPNSSEAQELLQRIAAVVRPIMQTRGWKVKRLREFYPRNTSLLGLNVDRGAEIRIRLRMPHDHTAFLRYEDLLGTMLHELVHIVQGPHDARFYAILDELKAEAEQLLAAGYSGDGFFSSGHKLDTAAIATPLHMQRDRALKAIAARQRLHSLGLGGPPRTLGGTGGSSLSLSLSSLNDGKTRTPAQMAAIAAERRRRDELWCGKASEAESESVIYGAATAGRSATSDCCDRTGGNSVPAVVVLDSDSDSDSGSEIVSASKTTALPNAAVVIVIDDD